MCVVRDDRRREDRGVGGGSGSFSLGSQTLISRWWVGAQAGFAARIRAAEGGEGQGRPRVWPGLVIPCRELGNTTHPKEEGDLYYILPYGLEYK